MPTFDLRSGHRRTTGKRRARGIIRRLIEAVTVVVFFALLATPLVGGFFVGEGSTPSFENRFMASLPPAPDSWSALQAWPTAFSGYLRDHFAWRVQMVGALNRTRYALFGETPTRQTVFGPTGRLFMTSHSGDSPFQLFDYLCNSGRWAPLADQAAIGIATLLRDTPLLADRKVFAIIPGPEAIYEDELPSWLRAQCSGPKTAERIVERFAAMPDKPGLLAYPLEGLIAARKSGEVIPRLAFHWSGRGGKAGAEAIAGQALGVSRAIDIGFVDGVANSDLQTFVPGFDTATHFALPDFANTEVTSCYGAQCFPELGDIGPILSEITRYVSPRAGTRRVLLLTDSFGVVSAPWFSEYFGETRHFSTNGFVRLTPDQLRKFRQEEVVAYAPDMIVYLFNDWGSLFIPKQMDTYLWGK